MLWQGQDNNPARVQLSHLQELDRAELDLGVLVVQRGHKVLHDVSQNNAVPGPQSKHSRVPKLPSAKQCEPAKQEQGSTGCRS